MSSAPKSASGLPDCTAGFAAGEVASGHTNRDASGVGRATISNDGGPARCA